MTTSASLTLAAATVTVPVLTIFGVPLGLRPDILVAGFGGALAAIILLNSVPSSGDTWREMLRTSTRRMAVVLASSVTAGYLVPLSLLLANVPESLQLAAAFAVGAGAQQALAKAVSRFAAGTEKQGDAP
jgi:hypothetical protein